MLSSFPYNRVITPAGYRRRETSGSTILHAERVGEIPLRAFVSSSKTKMSATRRRAAASDPPVDWQPRGLFESPEARTMVLNMDSRS